MKTGILVLAAFMMLASGVKAQPVTREIRTFKGMNVMHPDSNFRGRMGTGFQRHGEMNQQGMFRALNLTDEQVKAFKEIHMSLYKEVKPIQNQLNEAEAHQKTLLSADEPNLNAINDNIEKIGKLKTEIQKVRIKYLLEMRSKLTDEQRMKMDMMKLNHGSFKDHRMGGNFGGMNGEMRQRFNGPGGMNFGPGLGF